MKKSGIEYIDLIRYYIYRSLNIKENIIGIEVRSKSISGNGGAFFYFTRDQNFILKSINNDELEVLQSMIAAYTDRIVSEIPSFFARIFGVYKISIDYGKPTILILMENLSRKFKNPLIFDLKGSTFNRKSTITSHKTYESMSRRKVYKDTDFFNTIKFIDADHDLSNAIKTSIEKDVNLLEQYEIMDYSMLLFIEESKGVKEKFIKSNSLMHFGIFFGYIGIIDYLQNYSARKKIENKINGLKRQKSGNYSCIPTPLYKERFLNMVRSIFLN